MDTRIVAENAAELYKKAAEQYEGLPAFATRKKPLEWEPLSFRELYETGLDLAIALIELGVNARDHVGIFGDNRVEWIISDYGIQLSGAANVPRGSDVTDKELVYIVNHANIKVAFAETESIQNQLLRLKSEMPELEEIIVMRKDANLQDGVHGLYNLIERGKTLRSQGDQTPLERIEQIDPEDLFTLIYTSGTTGNPKGVMLTHANMMSQMEIIPINLKFTDRVLSILPVWHILERVIELFSIACGACTYYTSIRSLRDDLVNVEPTFMGSAPRLWENLYHKIRDGVNKSHPVRRALFHIAYFLGTHYQESLFQMTGNKLQTNKPPTVNEIFRYPLNALRWFLVLPWYGFFNATVLEQIRKTVGGSLKGTISGGGALPDEIDHFFNYIGIPVLEGYGLTETSPVLSVRTHDNHAIGTVGPPVKYTKIRIIDPETGETLYPNPRNRDHGCGLKGEIWSKGPQVMKGYYKQPELTEKSIIDGWFRTGDMGMMTYNGCLKVTGRLKSTIVLSNGENVEPEPIEMMLTESPYIDYVVLTGQDKQFLGALIVPNLDELKEAGVEVSTYQEAQESEHVRQILWSEIQNRVNKTKKIHPFEIVKYFRMPPKGFEMGDELTNLLKVKRHVVAERYHDLIEEMYSNPTVKA